MSADVHDSEQTQVTKKHSATLIEAVQRLYIDQGMTQAQVAGELGISPAVVQYVLRSRRIPTRPWKPAKTMFPVDLVEAVRKLYVDQRLSLVAVAAELNMAPSTVYTLVQNHHLPVRTPWEARANNVYPADLVEQVRQLYLDRRMSQQQVAEKLGTTAAVVGTLMSNHGLPTRVGGTPQDKTGDKNPSWRGDRAGYAAMHHRVIAARGTPKACDRCPKANPDGWYDWANVSGNYGDVDDYERLCRSCHQRLDAQRRRATGRATSTWNGLTPTGMPVEGFQPSV